MTDDRSLERAARSWIEAGPTQAPERAVEAALLRIQTTPQERDLRIPWRLPKMTTPARVAAAAVIGVLAIGGAYYLIYPNGPSNVAGPGPSPTASPSASAEPSASAALVHAAAPTTTLGDWQAMSDSAITGLFGANEHIQLSIDWQDGLHTWIQTTAGNLVLKSETLQAPAGEIHVRATSADTIGCAPGDLGRYNWSRSADGMFLTLTAIDDACANRRDAMSRVWVHSLSAVTDGRAGVYPFQGWIQMTLPAMRWGLSDTDLHTIDASDPGISFVAVQDPTGYDQPCSTTPTIKTIPPSGSGALTAYAAFLGALPGFDATSSNATVDGRQSVHVKLTPKASFQCPSGKYALFRDGTERDVAPGRPHSLWIIDLGGTTAIVWYDGDNVSAASEQAVISSMKFLAALPTP